MPNLRPVAYDYDEYMTTIDSDGNNIRLVMTDGWRRFTRLARPVLITAAIGVGTFVLMITANLVAFKAFGYTEQSGTVPHAVVSCPGKPDRQIDLETASNTRQGTWCVTMFYYGNSTRYTYEDWRDQEYRAGQPSSAANDGVLLWIPPWQFSLVWLAIIMTVIIIPRIEVRTPKRRKL